LSYGSAAALDLTRLKLSQAPDVSQSSITSTTSVPTIAKCPQALIF
jgi:hypothetical protein